MFGARVLTTSHSAEKLRCARAFGATDAIDASEHPDWGCAGDGDHRARGGDHIFERLGGENDRASVEAAAMGARIAMIGFLGSTDVPLR